MKLRGIDFNPASTGAGVTGNALEGYWFHPLLRARYGGDYCLNRYVPAHKTLVLGENKGNMELRNDGTPMKWFPDCIKVTRRGKREGYMFNAVGLSSKGIRWELEQGRLQKIRKHHFLSVACLKEGEEKLAEAEEMIWLLDRYIDDFEGPVGLQINDSCPNIAKGHPRDPVADSRALLEIANRLNAKKGRNIPIIPKFSLLTPTEVIYDIVENGACDAFILTNAINVGKLADVGINPEYGNPIPLPQYGNGSLSGKPLFPALCRRLEELVVRGITKPVWAGGGIFTQRDVYRLRDIGEQIQGIACASMFVLAAGNAREVYDGAQFAFRK